MVVGELKVLENLQKNLRKICTILHNLAQFWKTLDMYAQ